MKLSPNAHSLACTFCVAALLTFTGPAVAQEPAPGAQVSVSFPETVPHGLTITLRVDHAALPQFNLPAFTVELHNAGQHDLLLNLGTMSSDGERQYPTGITFVLTRPQGQPEQLVLKTVPDSSGTANKPFLLPLPAGATFSLPVDLRNYWVFGSNGLNSKLPAGEYVIEGQFTGLTGGMNVRSFPEQRPQEVPVSEGPFDHVNSQPNTIPTSNELHFEIAL